MLSNKPPALIMCPDYAGSLAAVRSLGRAGVPVTIGCRDWLSASRWSRFATHRRQIKESKTEKDMLDQLQDNRGDDRRHVLLAASDELAWLVSRHSAALASQFYLYSPSFEVIDKILDKKKLWEECVAGGIPTLPTWFPRDKDDLSALACQLQYPLIIKPRSHIFDTRLEKGTVVNASSSLALSVAAYVSSERSGKHKPSPQPFPILQAFAADAVENVVSISGFIDRSGTRFVLRASRKVIQRSRPVGLGLAFETIKVDPVLAASALRLCAQIKYFGIFEIEFVKRDDDWRLIDFNPRFYREMQLEIASGAPLPLLAYLDAIGDAAALDEAVAAAGTPISLMMGISDVFTTRIIVALRLFASRFADRDAIDWHWKMRGRLVDAFFDWRDPLPGVAHALTEIRRGKRFVIRKMVRSIKVPARLRQQSTREIKA